MPPHECDLTVEDLGNAETTVILVLEFSNC